jgi:hypothetical protein
LKYPKDEKDALRRIVAFFSISTTTPSPPQKGEFAGKVTILVDLVAEFLQNTNGESLQYLQSQLLDLNQCR